METELSDLMHKGHLFLLLLSISVIGCTAREPPLLHSAATSTQIAQVMPKDRSIPESVPKLEETAQTLTLVNGISFGMCLGYCTEEVVVTATLTSYQKKSNQPDAGEPLFVEELTTDQAVWSALMMALDLEALQALPEDKGCPDCADGGQEWIIATINGQTTRVDFEYGANLEEVSNFLMLLRNLREDLSTQFSD